MATLVSPGSDIQIINESFYTASDIGTIPLVAIATRTNKLTPNGKSIAAGTTKSMAGEVHLITSQRELLQTFGDPYFYSIQGTQQHAHELNEYGLLAAYQFLGQSSRCYVVRADVDTYQLQASAKSPRSLPDDQTVWFDLNDTRLGLFVSKTSESNPFVKQDVTFILDPAAIDSNGVPLSTYGTNGSYAMVVLEGNNRIYEKLNGNWFQIGSNPWKAQKNTAMSSAAVAGVDFDTAIKITDQSGKFITIEFDAISGETQYSAAAAVTKLNAAIAASDDFKQQVAFGLTSNGFVSLSHIKDSIFLSNVTGTPITSLKLIAGTYYGSKLTYSPHTNMPTGGSASAGSVWIKTTKSGGGAAYSVKTYNEATNKWIVAPYETPLYSSTANATLGMPGRQVNQTFIHYNTDGTDSAPLASHNIIQWTGSTWGSVVYDVNYEAPSTTPTEGTLWYNNSLRAEILVNNGTKWLGYRRAFPNTDPNGVILSSKKPTMQSDETPLVDQDLWLDTSDLENYPKIYRYNGGMRRWNLIDNTDQSTPYSAIVFADARENSGPEYVGAATNYVRNSSNRVDLLLSNYLDPDCVDPLAYPVGTLLFNTRYSTYNVKEWRPTWFAEGGFDANVNFSEIEAYSVGDDTVAFPALTEDNLGRWVSISGNNLDGSPKMGRHAQRGVIVKALQSMIASNENLRSELIEFNLMAAPGYPELIDEMLVLNADQKMVSFIIGDTPARLKPNATAMQAWATNANNAASNGDKGLTTFNENIAVYYPWGLSTNVDGSEVMVPPSSMALVTYAYNDALQHVWYAPAGFERGIVLNATSVGHLSDEGEYTPVILNQGQRDVMYLNKINPIAYIPKRGLALYGQKTLAAEASALDRVNVARLCNYLRVEIDKITHPFLFKINNDQIRDSFKHRLERFLAGLLGMNAIEDFAVVCDLSNNTVERRNRSELWADVLIIPTKCVEFIYVPVRIREIGDTLEL
jgi:hypothetical protein